MVGPRIHQAFHRIEMLLPASVKRGIKKLCPGVVGALYRGLHRYSDNSVVQTTIQEGQLAGRQFCCSLRDERFYFVGNAEPALQFALLQHLRPGCVFFDIGVHKGFFSLFAATILGPTGRVIGFEPHSANLQFSRANIDLNPDVASIVQFYDLAISDQSGVDQFDPQTDGSSTAKLCRVGESFDQGRAVSVSTTTLDDFVAKTAVHPDVIKIDIEGAEILAFAGMKQVLARCRPILIVELHNPECYDCFVELLSQQQYVGQRLTISGSTEISGWSDRDHYVAIPAEQIAMNAK